MNANTERLDRLQVTALLGVLTLLLLPHTLRLPLWMNAALAAVFGWRLWLLHTQRRLPPRWLLFSITFGLIAGVFFEYRTLLGKTGGVALLAVLVAAKLLETRARRDALLLVYLGYFLVITNFLFSQSLLMASYLFGMVAASTALLVSWHSRPPAGGMDMPALRGQFVLSLTLLLQALPLMVLLFLFFPRIEGPLWRLPQDRTTARSGLADAMSPGSFSNMTQSDEVAFRVSFTGPNPAQELLYWRGPVFDDYDGQTWTQAPVNIDDTPSIQARAKPVEYTITLEPHQRRWLLALELPTQNGPDTRISNRLQLLAAEPLNKRSRYTLNATLDYRAGQSEDPTVLQRALTLPEGNPRARSEAANWRTLPAPERVNAALRLFAREGLSYTLSPPLYGANAVDDFVYTGRAGFCEHFAGAFVFMLRAAGVPARVVGGYQGGDKNGDYLIIRQADAHAWAEVWLEGEGWRRVDPTFATAPSRIERGLAAAVPENALPLMLQLNSNAIKQLRLALDNVVNQWNQWVIGYTPQQQRRLLQRFGIDQLASSKFVLGFLGGLALLTAPLLLWLLWRMRPPRRDPARVLWDHFCARMARLGLVCGVAEGPLDFTRRSAAALPQWAPLIQQIGDDYLSLRYAPTPNPEALPRMRQRIAQLPRRV